MLRTVALSLGLLQLAACGGGLVAAVQIQEFPGDAVANRRRLEGLARTYEENFACTETDQVSIVGLAQGIYSVEGCNNQRDYVLVCQQTRGYAAAYGSGVRCDWQQMPSMLGNASTDLSCAADYLETQQMPNGTRVVSGCGFQATYVLQCAGVCQWVLASRVEQAGPAVTEGQASPYTY